MDDNKLLAVSKTYKLFINGEFARSERGRVLAQQNGEGHWMANYAWATRKDFRNAVVSARNAQTKWASRSAFNRGQILYRLAETMEDRRPLFVQKLIDHAGVSASAAREELSRTIDLIFSNAGWADKYAQLISSVNPVAGHFFNFTVPEPTGVVALICPRRSALFGLVAGLLPIILSGNSTILMVENIAPTIAIDFAEAVAVSDLPSGVINILTGQRAELLNPIATHADLNAVAYFGDEGAEIITLQRGAAETIKRLHHWSENELDQWQPSLYHILPFVEFKTSWHPVGS